MIRKVIAKIKLIKSMTLILSSWVIFESNHDPFFLSRLAWDLFHNFEYSPKLKNFFKIESNRKRKEIVIRDEMGSIERVHVAGCLSPETRNDVWDKQENDKLSKTIIVNCLA